MTAAPLKRHPDVTGRNFDGEGFIVVPGRGEYNITNNIGWRVWELIDGKRTMDDIVKVIAEEYEVTADVAQRDVQEFLDDLKEHEIIA